MPFTVANADFVRAGPLAHAAHTLPPWLGTMCSSGLASVPHGSAFRRDLVCSTSRSLRCDIERAGSPFQPRVKTTCEGTSGSCEPAPGPDDPSTPPWLGARGRFRQLNTAGLTARTAAPLRLLRPRARGWMRRELHERFMPERVWTDNKNNHAQSLYFVHRVIHSTRAREEGENHGRPCFQA